MIPAMIKMSQEIMHYLMINLCWHVTCTHDNSVLITHLLLWTAWENISANQIIHNLNLVILIWLSITNVHNHIIFMMKWQICQYISKGTLYYMYAILLNTMIWNKIRTVSLLFLLKQASN